MDTRLRNIDVDDWKEFKMGCLAEGVSCNSKMLELISTYVTARRAKRKSLITAELDELNQKKMF